MHGTIHAQLQKFVEAKHGRPAWDRILKEAGLGLKMYTPFETYPDEEAVKIVATASRITGAPVDTILQAFGEFIAPALLTMYKPYVKPEWKTLDMIENTEETIHRVVRVKNPGAAPPKLVAKRTSPDEVVIDYRSARRMCAVAKGIATGVARHYGERISISESTCMNKGGSACTISIRRLG